MRKFTTAKTIIRNKVIKVAIPNTKLARQMPRKKPLPLSKE